MASPDSFTVPSDSETYDADTVPAANPSSPSTSSSPLILYKPPTIWGLLRGAAINLILPFINGLMLGFGELVANEAAFRLGWSGTKVGTFTILYGLMEGLSRKVDMDRKEGYEKASLFCRCIVGEMKRLEADMTHRYSLRTAPNRAASGPASRCALIPWSVGAEPARTAAHTRR